MSDESRLRLRCASCGHHFDSDITVSGQVEDLSVVQNCPACGLPVRNDRRRDLVFAEAAQFDKSFRSLRTTVVAKELAPCVESFVDNIERIASLCYLPPELCRLATVMQSATSKALYDVTGRPGVNTRNLPRDMYAATVKIAERYREADQEAARRLPHEDPNNLAWRHGNFGLAVIVRRMDDDGYVHRGAEAVLSAALTSAWTAFETLAGDLWVAMLNARTRLAFTAMDAEPDPADSDEESDRKRKRKQDMPVQKLRDPTYRLDEHWGDVLRESGDWSFVKREKAKAAYNAAFGRLEPRLVRVFDDQDLMWLASLRNALVHRAGRADDESASRLKRHPALGTVKPPDRYPLDGPIVRQFVSAVSARGTEMLTVAADWLAANPQ